MRLKQKSLFTAALAMAIIVPSAVVPADAQTNQTKVANVSKDFKDVPKNHSAYKEIMEMRADGIISGYPDNTFRPAQSISRAHTAALFVRSLNLKPVRAGKEFKDVPKSHPYYNEVQTVYRAGIFDGKPNGTFGINDNLSRAQMAKVLVNAFGLKVKTGYIFTDIGADHWAKDYIATLYLHGITTGSNGKFMPNAPVSRAHYAAFLYRALNPDKAPVPTEPLKPTPPTPKPDPKPEPPAPPISDTPFPTGKVTVPKGWTTAKMAEHDKTIEQTVFEYAPKKGSGKQFGKTSSRLSDYNDDNTLALIEANLKAIGSASTIEQWVADVNEAVRTGNVVVASDYSYAVYIQYYNGIPLLVQVR